MAEQPRSWRHVLLGAVRPEFRAEVYVAEPGDPVLFGPGCAVAGCPRRGDNCSVGLATGGYLCLPHVAMWRRERRPQIDRWVDSAPTLRTQRVPAACAVAGCPRSVSQAGFCGAHARRWKRAGRPEREAFAAAQPAMPPAGEPCRAAGCDFLTASATGLCDAHAASFRWRRYHDGAATPTDYLAHLAERRRTSAPAFDLRPLPPLARLELQYVLQARRDARRAALEPAILAQLVRWVVEVGAESLLEHGEGWWARSAHERFRASVRANPLGLMRYAMRALGRLRDCQAGVEVWELDTWSPERLDPDGRYAHQRGRRIYFTDIEPPWLKRLVKRWARWRVSSGTKSPGSIACSVSSITRFSHWAADQDRPPDSAGDITRDLLERYRADVRLLDRSEARRSGLLTDLKVFLDDVRLLEWEPSLPANATYYRGEIPRARQWLPRFIDEFVMGQIESEANLARLPDLTTQTAVVILIETGLRSGDALRLPPDPITTDQAGAPYLRFFNHKLSREAIIPITERLVAQIRRQQADLRRRFPGGCAFLLPRTRANPDGREHYRHSTLNSRLTLWLEACAIRDAQGMPVRVTPHQFRHTLGTRLINNGVSIDAVRRMLDHASPEMTARYARIKDQTLRREWERYQERVNVRGEVVRLDPDGPMGDAAWAKENLSRAKQTLANGYCGLPLQQRCPHPNACLTCDHFLTTAAFLPVHREQLERTRELLEAARREGRERLVQMNEPVAANLERIIDGLGALEAEGD